MKRGPKPAAGLPYYALGGMIQVTAEQRDLMRRRVGGLTEWHEASTRSLVDLLANAYLLGLSDAAEVTSIQKDRARG